jgi:RNA polymerase sigma factor (sigma-70 family)
MIDRPNTTSASEPPAALSAIVQQHLDMVHATALSQLHDSHLADDATQAVFLLLLRRAANLPPAQFLPGWLYKTTCYVAAELRRQNLRRQRRDQEAHAMPEPRDPSSHAMSQEECTAVHAAIARLPAADRTAVVLSYLEGCTSAETAAALHTTETAVRIRLTRARERLRSLLRRAGITLSAAALVAVLETSKAQAAPAALLPQIQALVQGAAPASHILSLVNGVLHMTLRIKLLLVASTLVVLAIPLGIFVATLSAQKPTPTVAAIPATAPAKVTRLTPKDVILGAYQEAIAGKEDAFLTHFNTLSDSQISVLRAMVRDLRSIDLLLQAVAHQFGNEARAELERQLPTNVATSDIMNASFRLLDDDHAVANIGQSGPKDIPLIRVNDTWLFDSQILSKLNTNVVRQLDQQRDQITALTEAINAGKFPDINSLKATISQALK